MVLGAPSVRHASTQPLRTVYDGKNTSNPSGTMRATFTRVSPSSVLYSGVSLVLNEEFNAPPDGPTGMTLAHT
jgi:hypothetical protein